MRSIIRSMPTPPDERPPQRPPLKSKAEQIYQAVKASTAHPRARYLDHERLEVMQNVRTIINKGTEAELAEALSAFGKGPETIEGKALLEQFREMRKAD